MAYHFNATAPFPGVHFRLQFSSTNCETNLLSVTSRDTDHFYRIFLQNNTITLYIKLEDGKFEISVSLSGNKTFCDGVKHSVEFNRYGQNFLSEADGKEHSRYKEPRIRKVIFSKPDKILIGGMSENKFDGCIYSARIHFYWKKGSQNVSVDLLGQYVKGDSRVRFTDVFLGGCPRRGERKNPMEGELLNIIITVELRLCTANLCKWHFIAVDHHTFKLVTKGDLPKEKKPGDEAS